MAVTLPRTSEHLIREYVKFRVGKIVYVSVSPDETTMGFGFPKEERDALIAAEPGKFALPRLSDQRFHWVHARMGALEPTRCANWSLTPGGCAYPRRWRRHGSAIELGCQVTSYGGREQEGSVRDG